MKASKQKSRSLKAAGEAFESEERLSARRLFDESLTAAESLGEALPRSLLRAPQKEASKVREIAHLECCPEGTRRSETESPEGGVTRGAVSSDFGALTRVILAWYARHRRDLPWRAKAGEAPNPYHVWLSEIMLQQTTVTTVRPYFLRFVARWATVEALAKADLDAVRTAWSGLGYYSRATRLHQAAQKLAAQAAWPQTPSTWATYPGIGPYTSAAISAIAFGFPAVPVDGNIARLFQRLFARFFTGVETNQARLRGARKQAEAWARAVWQEGGAPDPLTDSREERALPPPQPIAFHEGELGPSALQLVAFPGDLAQALMDLGATVCLPRNPRCEVCPLRGLCPFDPQASDASSSKPLPRPRRLRHSYALGLYDRLGRIYVEQETEGRLLQGLMKVPSIDLPDAPVDAPLPFIRGIFSHFTWNVGVIRLRLASGRSGRAGSPKTGKARKYPMDELSREVQKPEGRTDEQTAARFQVEAGRKDCDPPGELTWDEAVRAAEAGGLDLEALPSAKALQAAFPYRLKGEWLTREKLAARPQSALLRKILRAMET